MWVQKYMNSRGCREGPKENAYVESPEFCATPVFPDINCRINSCLCSHWFSQFLSSLRWLIQFQFNHWWSYITKLTPTIRATTCFLDRLPTSLLRKCLPAVCPHITTIINNSLSTTIVVLGPLLFCIYMQPLGHIIRKYGLGSYFYADDTLSLTLSACFRDIKIWMRHNFVKTQLLKTKTYLMCTILTILKIGSRILLYYYY